MYRFFFSFRGIRLVFWLHSHVHVLDEIHLHFSYKMFPMCGCVQCLLFITDWLQTAHKNIYSYVYLLVIHYFILLFHMPLNSMRKYPYIHICSLNLLTHIHLWPIRGRSIFVFYYSFLCVIC